MVSSEAVDPVPSNNSAVSVSDAAAPPAILVQPSSRTLTNGGSVSFVVGASGTAPLAYQWQRAGLPVDAGGWTNIAGAVSASFSLPTAGFAERGSYRVRVTNVVGSVFSAPATLTVLLPPSISDIPNQQIDEDGATADLSFVVGDGDAPAGELVLSAVSSDTNLVPPSGFVFGGSGSNRTVKIMPAANRAGSATVTVTARDAQGLVASDVLVLTVNPVEDAPTLAAVPDQALAEDGPLTVPLTVGDAETAADSLTVTASATDTNLFPVNGGLLLGGSGTNRTLTLRPATNQHGSATVTVTVRDAAQLTATRQFLVTVSSVNDAPAVSMVGDQVIDENSAAGPLAIALRDVETAPEELLMVVSASNTNLFPLDTTIPLTDPRVSQLGIALAAGPLGQPSSGPGAVTNLLLTLTPASNRFGTSTVTVAVTDRVGGTNGLTTSRTFTLTVRQIVVPPSFIAQPQGATVTNGATVNLSAVVSGTAPLALQWRRNGVDMPGATNATLALTNVQAADAGTYRLGVTNSGGAAISDAAVVRVLVRPTITAIGSTGSGVEISFSTVLLLSYTVEFSDGLEAPVWLPLSPPGPLPGTGGVLTVTDPDPVAPYRVYRVRAE
jgi:hypothetical protein